MITDEDTSCRRYKGSKQSFECFYRRDESHNIDKGGYGIGLSIAQAIVSKYRGSIDAVWKDGVICFTCRLK